MLARRAGHSQEMTGRIRHGLRCSLLIRPFFVGTAGKMQPESRSRENSIRKAAAGKRQQENGSAKKQTAGEQHEYNETEKEKMRWIF